MFLVIVKGEINESEMSLKRAISEAIECEAKEYDERDWTFEDWRVFFLKKAKEYKQ